MIVYFSFQKKFLNRKGTKWKILINKVKKFKEGMDDRQVGEEGLVLFEGKRCW